MEQLADRACHGDESALTALLRGIEPDVTRICARSLRHEQDIQEACQDVLLAVSLKIHQFEQRSGFRTWVRAIAANCALDVYRRLKRRAGEQLTGDIPVVPDRRTTSVIAGTRIDLLEALEQLEKDKPALVEPVVLRELGQLSYNEIPDRLALPIDTVKTQIRRGRQHLREVLAIRHQ